MIYLTAVQLKPGATGGGFPLELPVVQQLGELQFPTAVTFLVGANGAGKSTLMEGIAAAAELPTVGNAELANDKSLAESWQLGRALRLSWRQRVRQGFFLRAEDLLGYARRLVQMRQDLQREARELEQELSAQGASAYSMALALGTVRGQLESLRRRYGDGLDHRSHGESFLFLLQERVVPNGLYLLDEPETPLSPQNQLTLLCYLHQMVGEGCQFIIATHSPMLLAFPGATIYSLDRLPPRVVDYSELEHVTLTRRFLNDPDSYFQRMFRS